jgi:hypothetical protein
MVYKPLDAMDKGLTTCQMGSVFELWTWLCEVDFTRWHTTSVNTEEECYLDQGWPKLSYCFLISGFRPGGVFLKLTDFSAKY